MFLLSVQLIWILAPLILGQYVLAIFCLTRLAYCKIPTRRYVVWNLVILLVFYVGSTVFLTYYFTHRKQLLTEPEQDSAQPELIVDTPITDADPSAAADTAVQAERQTDLSHEANESNIASNPSDVKTEE